MSDQAPRCFVIAHIGSNHHGSPELALRLLDAAADAGADAVAFDRFEAGRLPGGLSFLEALEIPAQGHADLLRHAQSRALLFCGAPFDEICADELEEIGVPLLKLGAGQIGDLGLLSHVAAKGRPVILGTGGATLGQVEAALGALAGCEVTLLQGAACPAEARPANANLRAMFTLHTAFGVSAGYADRCAGFEVALAAVALGARIIEKPLTMDRHVPGPDQPGALEPGEFSRMVAAIRNVEAALGDGRKWTGLQD